MSVATAGPAAALRDLLPSGRVLGEEEARRWNVWSDGGPSAVVLPESTEEAAQVLARASAHGWRVEPAGSGTWLPARGRAPDVVLSAARMKRIVAYEPADLTITAEAGITLSALAAVISPNRQWLPLDPPGRSRSLGAVASLGRWGPLGAAWGGPRDLALGLRAVTGDGRVFNAGGRVVKNVAGFDLVRLLVGSRGTLAFLTEATFRLYPTAEADRTLVWRAGSLEELATAAVAACAHPITPSAVDLIERTDPVAGRREARLGVRLVGGRERVADEAGTIAAALPGGPVTLAPADADAFWKETQHLEDDADLALGLTILPTRIAEAIEIARATGRMRDGHDELARSPVRIGVHAPAGHLRLAVPRVRSDSGWDERWAERLSDLGRTLSWKGGTLSVARAPAAITALVEPAERSAVQAELTAGLEAVFDPAGILSVDRCAY